MYFLIILGLFHKAIIHSGCALNTWVLSKSCSKEVAENLNILYTTDKALLNALQRISVHELLVIQDMLTDVSLIFNKYIKTFHDRNCCKNYNFNEQTCCAIYFSFKSMFIW